MLNEQDVKNVCQTLFAFKANAYVSSMQEILRNIDQKVSSEQTVNAFKESISLFFIELYSILDTCSKDLLNEEQRDAFWAIAEATLLEASNKWLEQMSSKSTFVQKNKEMMSRNIQEFQKRAVHFHKERQRLSRSYKQQLAKV